MLQRNQKIFKTFDNPPTQIQTSQPHIGLDSFTQVLDTDQIRDAHFCQLDISEGVIETHHAGDVHHGVVLEGLC